jgi:hypothetical protein
MGPPAKKVRNKIGRSAPGGFRSTAVRRFAGASGGGPGNDERHSARRRPNFLKVLILHSSLLSVVSVMTETPFAEKRP